MLLIPVLFILCSILGHEGIIEVIDHMRPKDDGLKKGNRLTFHVVNCCGKCERCKDGLQQKCVSLFKVSWMGLLLSLSSTKTLNPLVSGVVTWCIPSKIILWDTTLKKACKRKEWGQFKYALNKRKDGGLSLRRLLPLRGYSGILLMGRCFWGQVFIIY